MSGDVRQSAERRGLNPCGCEFESHLPYFDKEILRVNGPYLIEKEADRRRYVIIRFRDGSTTSMAWARWLMTAHVGRRLTREEHVHHINEDSLDDRLDNYEIITPQEHRRRHGKGHKMIEFICPMCEKVATKEARFVKHNRKMGKAGPFCGRECARAWQLAATA